MLAGRFVTIAGAFDDRLLREKYNNRMKKSAYFNGKALHCVELEQKPVNYHF
jgi:hypothetical protein